jgi:hypothetical protein
VTRELEARGYRRVESDPDLLVNFAMTTEDIQDVRTMPSAGLPPPWYGWRGGYYYPWPAYSYETYVDRYERGTLFIDLVDAERRQLVWEGRAVGRITKATREDPAGALDNAVAEIFARIPSWRGRSASALLAPGWLPRRRGLISQAEPSWRAAVTRSARISK